MQVSHTEGRALYMVDLDEGVKREGNLNKGERSKEGQRGRKEERREEGREGGQEGREKTHECM